MTRSPQKARTLTALLPLAALVLTPILASAELTAWNQEQVTAIAGELVETTRDLRSALRKQPPATLGQPGRRAFFVLQDELSSIESTARRLHNALSEGATREETLATYQRLIRSVRTAAREVPRAQVTEPASGKLKTVADVLRRLRPYYEEEPLV